MACIYVYNLCIDYVVYIKNMNIRLLLKRLKNANSVVAVEGFY